MTDVTSAKASVSIAVKEECEIPTMQTLASACSGLKSVVAPRVYLTHWGCQGPIQGWLSQSQSAWFLRDFPASLVFWPLPLLSTEPKLWSLLFPHSVYCWPIGKVLNHLSGESQLLATGITMSVLRGQCCSVFLKPNSLISTPRRAERGSLSAWRKLPSHPE